MLLRREEKTARLPEFSIIRPHKPILGRRELDKIIYQINYTVAHLDRSQIQKAIAGERVTDSLGSDISANLLFYYRLGRLIKVAQESLIAAESIVVIGNLANLGDFLIHSRLVLVLAKHFPDKNIVFLAKYPDLINQERLPENLTVTSESCVSYLASMDHQTHDKVFIFNPTFDGFLHHDLASTLEKRGYQTFPADDIGFQTMDQIPLSLCIHSLSNLRDPTLSTLHNLTSQQLILKLFFGINEFEFETPITKPIVREQCLDIVIVYDAYFRDRLKMLPIETWVKIFISMVKKYPDKRIGIIKGVVHPKDVDEIARALLKAKINVTACQAEDILMSSQSQNEGLNAGVYIVSCADEKTDRNHKAKTRSKIMSCVKKAFVSSSDNTTNDNGDNPYSRLTALQKLLNIIASCQVYVGTDTGPTHIAHELKRMADAQILPRTHLQKVIGIFNRTPFAADFWLPSAGHTLIYEDIKKINPSIIWQQVEEQLREVFE